MSFQRFVCWNSEAVRNIIETEALQTSDHVFLATHHPMKIYREDLGRKPTLYDEQAFIDEFLSNPDGTFVVVNGEAGTGKSHLIRRLSVNIHSSIDRTVILIPRVNTNLKNIIQRILDEVEGDQFDEYRQRLDRATGTLSVEEARIRLLNELAISVSSIRHEIPDDDDLKAELIHELPNLLGDPVYRDLLDNENSIVHRLAEHILGHVGKIERREEPDRFEKHDLPHQISDITELAGPSRDLLSTFGIRSEFFDKAIDWINENLSDAFRRVLDISGEDLNELFLAVRESLADEGKELVLLIEDFAKLQGIDLQLLEALIVGRNQVGHKKLCPIRTALACTTGYYTNLPQNVHDRISFRINMDLSTRTDDAKREDVAQFASRYLNAIRVEDETLRSWFLAEMEDSDNNDIDINSCLDCPNREPCHTGFGHRDEIGLYPFNEVALEKMLSRVRGGDFNPRNLLNGVLRPVLEQYRPFIENGTFPPPELLDRYGPSQLTAIVQADLQNRDPENLPRRRALIELWSAGDKVVDLEKGIHDAFELPLLGNVDIASPPKAQVKSTVTDIKEKKPRTQEALPAKIVDQIEQLDRWKNSGAELQQNTVNQLRGLVFDCIREHINWDIEMLLPGHFRQFRRTSIQFTENPKGILPSILLKIPVNKKTFDEVFALQGLILFDHFKTWAFPNNKEGWVYHSGGEYFRFLAGQLEIWSDQIIRQIKRSAVDNEVDFNPVPAATELLAIGARLAGQPLVSKDSLEDYVDALFMDYSKVELSGKTSTWLSLLKVFKRDHAKLKDLVLARVPCTKGSSNPQMIDAVQLVDAVKKIRRNWNPTVQIPDLRQDCIVIQSVREQVDNLLVQVVVDEREERLGRLRKLVEAFGDEIDKQEIVEQIKKVIEKARATASLSGIGYDTLMEDVAAFQRCQLDQALDILKNLQEEDAHEKLFPELSRGFGSTLDTAERFIESIERFLDSSIKKTESDLVELRGGGGELVEKNIRQVEGNIETLIDGLNDLGGMKCDT